MPSGATGQYGTLACSGCILERDYHGVFHQINHATDKHVSRFLIRAR